jgi:hypothetical protein
VSTHKVLLACLCLNRFGQCQAREVSRGWPLIVWEDTRVQEEWLQSVCNWGQKEIFAVCLLVVLELCEDVGERV